MRFVKGNERNAYNAALFGAGLLPHRQHKNDGDERSSRVGFLLARRGVGAPTRSSELVGELVLLALFKVKHEKDAASPPEASERRQAQKCHQAIARHGQFI